MRTATLALLGLLLGARGATADVIHVPADQPTIQAAINAAVDGDEVVIGPGTYNEVINFNGKAITVRGSGPDVTMIDGTGLSSAAPVVRLSNGEDPSSVLRDLTVTGGHGTATGGASGIWASNANPTIINCHITGNSTSGAPIAFGGGLRQTGIGMMVVQDCVFSNNSSSGSEMSNVNASGGGANVSNALFINCAFISNHASGFTFFGDSGSADGGGVSGSAVLINCFIHGNSASGGASASGGGVSGGAGGIALVNCVITGNSVSVSNPAGGGTGAGLRAFGSALLNNCTIANNVVSTPKASSVGGVWGSASLANCIVVNNTSTEVHSTGSATVHHSCIEGGFPGEGNIDANPLFIDPANGDFRLQDASPCRDTGENASLPADIHDLDGDGNTAEQLSRDLDLLRRKVNGIVDMGAYEWQHACASDIAPSSPGVAGDGIVDVDDLVAVILGWGACDQCVADINGDDVVDVDDLVLVILSWGPCR